MSNWIAKTRSGKTYLSDQYGVTVSGDEFQDHLYYPQPTLKSFRVNPSDPSLTWEYLGALPAVDRPVVGERLYINTFGDAGWRISTEIVRVEDAEWRVRSDLGERRRYNDPVRDDPEVTYYREGVDQVLVYIEAIHAYPNLLSELKWAIEDGII